MAEEMSRKERRRLEREQRRQEMQQSSSKSKGKGKRNLVLLGVVIIILIGAGIVATGMLGGTAQGQYDEFAQCMTQKGAEMYGAYWCPNCQRQELMFGKSFNYIKYVECDPNGAGRIQPGIVPNPQLCQEKGITGYPTWIFADGQRLVGSQNLETLAQVTGCQLS